MRGNTTADTTSWERKTAHTTSAPQQLPATGTSGGTALGLLLPWLPPQQLPAHLAPPFSRHAGALLCRHRRAGKPTGVAAGPLLADARTGAMAAPFVQRGREGGSGAAADAVCFPRLFPRLFPSSCTRHLPPSTCLQFSSPSPTPRPIQVAAIEAKYGTQLSVSSPEELKAIYGTFVEAAIPAGACGRRPSKRGRACGDGWWSAVAAAGWWAWQSTKTHARCRDWLCPPPPLLPHRRRPPARR